MTFPWPYLDRAGFTLRTPMPANDVALIAFARPGYVEARIAAAQSYIEGRLRKRYARSIPFGGTPPLVYASGTTPPAVQLQGTPQIGSMRLSLKVSTAGADGAAAFIWSLDGGRTLVGSLTSLTITAAGLGYSVAPAVTIDPPAPGGTQATATTTIDGTGAVISTTLTNAGSGYTQIPNVSLTPGPTAAQSALAVCTGTTAIAVSIPTYNPAAPTLVPLPGTGLSGLFFHGTFAADNLFQTPTPVPEVILGWIVAMVTPEVYRARGVNPQDVPIEQLENDRIRVIGTDGKGGELREAADGQNGLIDLPSDDALGSAVSNGPYAHSEASPYVAFDEEVRRARREDFRSFDRFGGEGPVE